MSNLETKLALVSSWEHELLNESSAVKWELLRNVCEHVSWIYIVALNVASCPH